MSIVFITIFINSKTIMTGYDTSGEDFQSIKVLGKVLLNEYMFPFEFISILLLVAMIGTVLLTKKEKNNDDGDAEWKKKTRLSSLSFALLPSFHLLRLFARKPEGKEQSRSC